MDDVFIATEADGSQWVSLEDYRDLQQKYVISELALDEQIKMYAALIQQRRYCEKCQEKIEGVTHDPQNY